MELGAGIGRFTSDLAKRAQSVIAVDFMQNLISENEVQNNHYGNIDFRCADATLLELPSGSLDVIFSNWLLMYLSDEEVEKLALNMLKWLGDDGLVFFRESCFRQSGDRSRASNPTHYRNPREYFRIFDGVSVKRDDGKYERFELVCCKSVDTYVRVKQNQNQVCWKWRKVLSDSPGSKDLRHFLDGSQYTSQGITKYQMIFGDGFVSPGGIETTAEFSKMLEVKTDENVLDLGCGVGGAAIFIARQYGCYVYGVDLSVNMIMCALEAAAATGNGDKVSFEVSDFSKPQFRSKLYDAAFSRDAFFYVKDKRSMLKSVYDGLKPGARLVMTDYCAGTSESDDFKAYVVKRGYTLTSIDEYASILKEAGFEVKMAEDRSEQLMKCIEKEIERVESDKARFEEALGKETVQKLENSWKRKLQFVKNGDHSWGLFLAVKKAE